MKCKDPILCYRNKWTGKTIYRHFSLSRPIHKLTAKEIFNCGKCLHCRKKRSYELAMRCVLNASLYQQNCFITLTHDENRKGYHNDFDYREIQLFKKRLRQRTKEKIQIFNVHEYGKNGKKHWHLVIFNYNFADRKYFTTKNGNAYYTSDLLSELWPYGHHTIGAVSEASAMYQAQYTQKDFKNGNVTNKRKSHSKHSGIGRDYFNTHYRQILSLGYVPFMGRKIPIPRYFQKIAHRHWSHFYEQKNFFDFEDRKKLYSPFKPGQANKYMADLYTQYKALKQEKIDEYVKEWDEFIDQQAFSKLKQDFQISGENQEYDLRNKLTNNQF